MDTIKNTNNFQILFQSIRYKQGGKLKSQGTITKNSNLLALLVIPSYLRKSYLALFERSVTLKDTEFPPFNSVSFKVSNLKRHRIKRGKFLSLSENSFPEKDKRTGDWDTVNTLLGNLYLEHS